MILVVVSLDDVFVNALFMAFIGIDQGIGISFWNFAKIPLPIFFGLGLGIYIEFCLFILFKKYHMRDRKK